jgi:hypothetical protein
MDNVTEKIYKALSEKKGWSRNFAEGFLKGKYARVNNIGISPYGSVGIDDYSNGFRAGYYGRRAPRQTGTLPIAA